MMRTLTVDLGERSYPIHIGPGLLSQPGLVTPFVAGRQVVIVSNETVAPLYLERARAAFTDFRCEEIILPDGEQYKDLATLNRIFDALLERRCDRGVTLVALGGGVIGDMTGFAAACYQRGVAFIQIPTTLLAQVDSSVGGKTGINHRLGKNMIGAFHQPRCVIADTHTLRTLSEREYRAGIAEIVKYGLIRDAAFLGWLEQNAAAVLARDDGAIMYAVRRSCEIKAEVVALDEREQGLRAILNLGHTFGHAIETAAGYGNWLHGEAVGAGMAIAADLSQRLGWLALEDRERIVRLLERFGLPLAAPRIGARRARELMGLDKKVLDGRIRLVLLRRLGAAEVVGDYPNEALDATLQVHFD